jgi:hypothetical protein
LGPDGNFYGEARNGGGGDGTVFEFTTNGMVVLLAQFGGDNGEIGSGTLALGSDGNFYGATKLGGATDGGEIFLLDLPPEIIQQPATQSVLIGNQASFSVTLFGTAPYSFRWLSNSISVFGATNETFTLPNVSAADGSGYSVVITNDWGNITSSVAT